MLFHHPLLPYSLVALTDGFGFAFFSFGRWLFATQNNMEQHLILELAFESSENMCLNKTFSTTSLFRYYIQYTYSISEFYFQSFTE